MENQHSFAVRKIFSTVDGYSQVSIDSDTFNKVRGMRPELPYTTGRNKAGQGVRIFDINGNKLMSVYNKEEKKSGFIMTEAQANANLRTIEQERADEPVLNFAF